MTTHTKRKEAKAALDGAPLNGYGFHELTPDQVEQIKAVISPKIGKPSDRLPEYVTHSVYGDELHINIPMVAVFQHLLAEMEPEYIVDAVTQKEDLFHVFVDRVTEWTHTLEIGQRIKLQEKLGGMLFEMQLDKLSHKVMNVERDAAKRFETRQWVEAIADALRADMPDHERALKIIENLKANPVWRDTETTKVCGTIWNEAGAPWREWLKGQLQATIAGAWTPTHLSDTGAMFRVTARAKGAGWQDGSYTNTSADVVVYENSAGEVFVRTAENFANYFFPVQAEQVQT